MAGLLTQQATIARLTSLIANLLNGCKMHLFSTNITPTTTTTLATLAAGEASFTGYAAATLNSWSTPAIDGSGAAASSDTQGQFTGTSGGGTGNIYGYYLTNAAGTEIYGCERFAGAPLSQVQNVVFEVDVTYSDITR